MTWSYGQDPAGSSLDAVRFLVRDTDTTSQLISDEDIAYWSARCDPVFGDDLMTAAFCAENIAARFAGEVSISADGATISGDQLQTKYTALAASLRAQYKTLNVVGGFPQAGGIDDSPPEPGVKSTAFGIGLDDNDRVGQSHYGYRHSDRFTDEGGLSGDVDPFG